MISSAKGNEKILILSSILIIIVAAVGILAFLYWQSSFQEKAEDTADTVSDSVGEDSQVLIDILREDINEVEAELACRDKGGTWINGACISVEENS